MNMPGFTAEASVYKVKGHYHTTNIPNEGGGVSEGVRLAQMPFCHRGRANCVLDCEARCDDDPYYCGINCRCCCSGRPPFTCYQ
jgi:hypothetical protein